ncbi:YHYH protein [Erythrobacter crassostreae]|uniref:YHYH protein n=1 Tax=Erythrobacter crassostreae TaxID=2828328 RepID=A0A9X1JN61_9SPHN|nr:YHYH protein [Erythrobacter crassostrea]MBV7258142.1 YHYH protein [Erythrobacter crassostrea]
MACKSIARTTIALGILAGSHGHVVAHDLSSVSAQHAGSDASLPVGDGRVSTDAPQTGYVYSCTSDFRTGGARHYGEWLRQGRWFPDEKVVVSGEKSWPEAYFEMVADKSSITVKMNSLPTNHPTGTFPIARSDPAYQYDTNPNPIAAQALELMIPAQPSFASEPGCLRRGMIGFTVNGVALYNALDDAGLDAAAHEVQDACAGHPSGRGQYHYHAGAPCIPGIKENAIIGWAIDGFPIMGLSGGEGQAFTNSDLDECHGHAQQIAIDGRNYSYAYRVTAEYPYTLGCYKGTILRGTNRQIREGLNTRRIRGAAGGNRERQPRDQRRRD